MRGRWWDTEWWIGVVVVAALALTLRYDPLAGVEGWGYDLALRFTAPAHRDEGVLLVAADEALANADNSEALQQLMLQLRKAQPRTVALFWPQLSSTTPPQLVSLAQEAGELLPQMSASEATPLLQQLISLADSERKIAATMKGVDHLYLAGTPRASWSPQWSWSLEQLLIPRLPNANAAPAIAPAFAEAARVAGDSAMAPPSSVVRRVPLFYRDRDGTLAATLPLQLLMERLGADPRAIRYNDGEGVEVDKLTIATDAGGYMLPRWSDAAPQRMTLDDLLYATSEKLDTLHGKMVLIGAVRPPFDSQVSLPDGRRVAPVELAALELSALTQSDVVRMPHYARWLQVGALLLVLLVLTQLLPRLSNVMALVSGGLLLAAMLNAQLLLFMLRGTWLPLLTPVLALGIGLLLLMWRRRVASGAQQLQQQLTTVTVALAQQLRHQGQLDEALHHLQQCPPNDACDELYQLGLDYERKRQFNKAEQVFEHISRALPRFKDVAERARINREARERIVIAGHPANNMAGTLVLDQGALQKPLVGRYEVDRELGRGAMGMVYLGHDPKISRTVAIKTVTLAHDYDEEQLAQVRKRFFREAESAGRLSHPHIVTIYDVGEEGDLAYIAMDYLEGVSLDHHTTKENLLPVAEVMEIIAQVADALAYAHSKGVVHRDIKPANIIYDREKREATVTDFGVAHLTDASKTRTGTVLGSPYYMAPEQLAGTRVDGRADLFSLGVTFYQLLTGALPFEADSIATLMYKIANSRHVSVSKLRRGVPTCASRIVNQLLQKDVEKRFQNGTDLHKALQRCLK